MSNMNILAIDQGTTSSRAILFSAKGKILRVKQKELKLHYPQPGWVEQKPQDIWNDTLWTCRGVLRGADTVASIGITNQRETTILWDRKTGKPVYNAIVWQDRRTAPLCEKLRAAGHERVIAEATGLVIDPYFSATKVAWILDNVPGARKRAEAGDIAFGTVDTWLLWNLTGGRVHATDATNAGRTMLFNIRTQKWDEQLLKLFGIPCAILPEVRDNVVAFGKTKLFGKELVIGGMAGDQQAALVGQACFNEGMVKATYGTGCFALMNAGPEFRLSKNKLLTTPAYRLDGKTTYAVEGSIFIAGAAVQWLRDGLKVIKKASDSEKLARSVKDSGGVYFVPAFTGLGAPYWNSDARASISGLTRGSTTAHIVRAALEAQAFQTVDLMNAMKADTGESPAVIRADGGLVANKFVCQFIADMLDVPLDIPTVTETTALGAAYLAGLQAGVYDGLDDISQAWRRAKRYRPRMKAERRRELYSGWNKAIAAVTG
ncbi:MAG TPA: glycerol kinase GlpK [Patescibacteria group bacterium]|nr:glycerol kinase GlpK [Patescibacteria group bacterium]